MMADAEGNVFAKLPQSRSEEVFQEIVHGEKFRLERIISFGQATPVCANGMTRSSMIRSAEFLHVDGTNVRCPMCNRQATDDFVSTTPALCEASGMPLKIYSLAWMMPFSERILT